MNHNNPPRRRNGAAPLLADFDRVVLGPAMPATTRHWLLFDGHPMGVLDLESGAFWPLMRDPGGRFHLAADPSRPSW